MPKKNRPGRLGRLTGRDPDHERARTLHPFSAETTVRTRRFWKQDGWWGDQGNTGTCVAFALTHRHADPPMRHAEVPYERQWVYDLYVEATGDTSLQEGTWAHVVARRMMERGLIKSFEWVTSPAALRYAVLERGTVCVGTYWHEQMFWPRAEHNNKYLHVEGPIVGGHEYLVNAIELEPEFGGPPYYRVKNSWGRNWGKNGTARIACTDLEALVFDNYGDAVVLSEVKSA